MVIGDEYDQQWNFGMELLTLGLILSIYEICVIAHCNEAREGDKSLHKIMK